MYCAPQTLTPGYGPGPRPWPIWPMRKYVTAQRGGAQHSCIGLRPALLFLVHLS